MRILCAPAPGRIAIAVAARLRAPGALTARHLGVAPSIVNNNPTPAVGKVDWNAWWAAVDKQIQEHVVAERQLITEAVGEALALERRSISRATRPAW
jgi:hypothetical protein